MKRLILKAKTMMTRKDAERHFMRIYNQNGAGLVISPGCFDVIQEIIEWTELKTAQPKKYQDLIVCNADGIEYIATMDDLDRFIASSGEKIENVVAWMPAPKPYEVKND